MIKKQLNLHTDINQNTNSKTNALTLCALAYNFSVLKYRLSKHKFIHTILIFSSISTTGNLEKGVHIQSYGKTIIICIHLSSKSCTSKNALGKRGGGIYLLISHHQGLF